MSWSHWATRLRRHLWPDRIATRIAVIMVAAMLVTQVFGYLLFLGERNGWWRQAHLDPAVERLRREAASLKQIAGWPGMSLERAARLLNALYLGANLMVSRSGAAARPEPRKSLFGWLGGR